MSKRASKYLGFVGCMGFLGFRYFASGDPVDLCQFAWFAFFAYFWTSRLTVDIPDERYFHNVQQARAFVGTLAAYEITALYLLSIFFTRSAELFVFGIAFTFASLVVGYAVKLHQLEEK